MNDSIPSQTVQVKDDSLVVRLIDQSRIASELEAASASLVVGGEG